VARNNVNEQGERAREGRRQQPGEQLGRQCTTPYQLDRDEKAVPGRRAHPVASFARRLVAFGGRCRTCASVI
jgi:hypothetical protein